MSYATIAACTADVEFQARLTGALADEGVPNPEVRYYEVRWQIAADPSIEPPYAYAIETGNPSPGGDPTVVTDEMLLAAVQAAQGTPAQ